MTGAHQSRLLPVHIWHQINGTGLHSQACSTISRFTQSAYTVLRVRSWVHLSHIKTGQPCRHACSCSTPACLVFGHMRS
eukprot:1161864-Pelagomonas_calceolata.AAC.30